MSEIINSFRQTYSNSLTVKELSFTIIQNSSSRFFLFHIKWPYKVQIFRKQVNYKVPLDNTLENPKKAQKEAQQKIDDAVELTEEEQGKYFKSQ